MNWLRSKFSDKEKKSASSTPAPAHASSSSSSTSAAASASAPPAASSATSEPKKEKEPKPEKGSDDEEEEANLELEDACKGCSSPCEEHAQMPDAIAKKISHGVMTGSVKDHKRHFLLATGGSADTWPSEIDKTKYAAAFDKEISAIKKQVGYGCRVTLTEESTTDEHGCPLSPSMSDSIADITVFPDMIRFHRVHIDQIPTLLNYILLDKEYNKKGVNTRKETDEKHDSSTESKTPESNFLPISIPHTRLSQRAVVMICGHKLRDKRCAVAAALLEQEFDRQLKKKDMTDQVHVTKISHVGGHKYAGNVIIYPGGHWFGRVTTCHVSTLLDGYILNGKVPEPIVRGRVELDDSIPRYHPPKACQYKDW